MKYLCLGAINATSLMSALLQYGRQGLDCCVIYDGETLLFETFLDIGIAMGTLIGTSNRKFINVLFHLN